METTNDMQAFRQQIILSLLRNEAFSCGHDPKTGTKITLKQYGDAALTAADTIINAMKEPTQFEEAATAGLKQEIQTLREFILKTVNGKGCIVNTSMLTIAQIAEARAEGRMYVMPDGPEIGWVFGLGFAYMPASIYNHGTRRPTDVQAAEISALRQENEALKKNYKTLQETKAEEFYQAFERAGVKSILLWKNITEENKEQVLEQMNAIAEDHRKIMEGYELASVMNDYYNLEKQYRKADHHWTSEIAELKRRIESYRRTIQTLNDTKTALQERLAKAEATIQKQEKEIYSLEHEPPMIIGMDNYVDLPITLDGIPMTAKLKKEDKQRYDDYRRTAPPNVVASQMAVSQPEPFTGPSWTITINDEAISYQRNRTEEHGHSCP